MYTVRKRFKDEYEVANFGDRKEPDAVYTVRKARCSCPAAWGRKSCKHVSLVNRFKTLGESEGVWWFEMFDGEIFQHRLRAFE
jgi:hypothetical protein